MKLTIEIKGRTGDPKLSEMDELIEAVAIAQKNAVSAYHEIKLISAKWMLVGLKKDLEGKL
jgi:hypothetical protein